MPANYYNFMGLNFDAFRKAKLANQIAPYGVANRLCLQVYANNFGKMERASIHMLIGNRIKISHSGRNLVYEYFVDEYGKIKKFEFRSFSEVSFQGTNCKKTFCLYKEKSQFSIEVLQIDETKKENPDESIFVANFKLRDDKILQDKARISDFARHILKKDIGGNCENLRENLLTMWQDVSTLCKIKSVRFDNNGEVKNVLIKK